MICSQYDKKECEIPSNIVCNHKKIHKHTSSCDLDRCYIRNLSDCNCVCIPYRPFKEELDRLLEL